jgi:hypothetical protein
MEQDLQDKSGAGFTGCNIMFRIKKHQVSGFILNILLHRVNPASDILNIP